MPLLSNIKSALHEKLAPVGGEMPPFQPHDLLLVLVSLLVAVCKSFSQTQYCTLGEFVLHSFSKVIVFLLAVIGMILMVLCCPPRSLGLARYHYKSASNNRPFHILTHIAVFTHSPRKKNSQT